MNRRVEFLPLLIALALFMTGLNVSAAESSTPYKSLVIPGDVWAADFDNGGEGVAYIKGTLSNGISKYRQGENINLWDLEYGVGAGLNSVIWVKYTVDVKKSGNYKATVYYATPELDTTLDILFDDKVLTGGELTPTSDYEKCCEQEFNTFNLTKGTHVMQYNVTKGNLTLYKVAFEEVGGNNEKKVDFSKKTGSYRTAYIPTIIEAEDFDLGTSGSKSKDGKNSGGQYRKNDRIDIYNLSGEKYYVTLASGEYTRYTFNVKQSGVYAFLIAAGKKGSIDTYFDDRLVPLTATLDGKSDFAEIKIANIYFEEGEHYVTLAPKGEMNIDYLKFMSSNEDYITLESLNKPVGKVDGQTEGTEKLLKIYKNLYISEDGNDDGTGEEGSPFKTIDRAKKEIMKINSNMDGDIVVNILPGYYKLDETETFGVEHSGKNGYNVVIRGASELSPPIISGGIEVKNWEKSTDQIWKASVKGAEEVRNLYINGFAAQRARSKYRYEPTEVYNAPGSEYVEDGLKISDRNFPQSFAHPEDLELVWNILWTSQRTPVENIIREDGKVTLVMDQPYYNWARTKSYDSTNPKIGEKFYLENGMELLDEPGEFYYNKEEKTIYYYSFNKEDLNSSDTYIGATELMFSVKGESIDKPISNMVFENLDIRYGAWNDVSRTGLIGIQADKIIDGPNNDVARGGRIPPAQFTILNADNIIVKKCKFSCLGSGAISMEDAVSNSKVEGNQIRDISGTGVIIGSWDHTIKREDKQQCENIDVLNNVIWRVSTEFSGGCGISVYYEKNISICHNDIREVPYTGISAGWGWGEEVDFGGIKISYNRIEDVLMPPIEDGAHIYTLGPLRNSEISNNHLIKSFNTYFGGIYTDSGSAYLKIHNNVIENVKHWFFAYSNRIHDVEVYDNFTNTEKFVNDGINVNISNTVVVSDGVWQEEARKVIENAGVEPKYKKLLNGIRTPKWRESFLYKIPKVKFLSQDDASWYQAEDFMKGGEGVGYHKIKPGNEDKVYRDEGVVIYKIGEGYVVGTTMPEEWLNYEVNIPETGTYYLDIKAANAMHTTGDIEPNVNVYIDGVLIVESASIAQTTSWNVNLITKLGSIDLEKGTHIVKFEFENNGFSFDAFKFGDGKELSNANDRNYDEGVLIYENDKIDFTDIENHWAKNDILAMTEKGLVNGISKNAYAPDDAVTRNQAVWLALRVMKIKYDENNWEDDALKYGMITEKGVSNRAISREEFADILMKAYISKHVKYKLTVEAKSFGDIDNISVSYLNAVLGAKELGLMTGDQNGNFNSKDCLTRAEAAVVIERLSKLEAKV